MPQTGSVVRGRIAPRVAMLVLIAILIASIGGCFFGAGDRDRTENEGSGADGGVSVDGAEERTVKVTLYFGDSQALELLPEEREVPSGDPDSVAESVLRELVEGPREEGHVLTIPKGTRVLSVEIRDGVAYADFSKELVEKHWGGSTGELFTVYSVVNTLTELEGVDAVQLLVEGEPLQTLGHMDLSEPLERDEGMMGE